MKVLVACEFSGVVRQAFRDAGHDAVSWDLLPAEDESIHHIQGPIKFAMLYSADKWDLMIAHPPCTYLTNAGARWWAGKAQEQADALAFVRMLMACQIPRIAIENPPGKIGTAIRPADQYIQPWEHGHMETKRTGLWLKGLPKLMPTKDVHSGMMNLTLAQRSRVHWMPPGPNRSKNRSRTLPGIGAAMAAQWGAP